MTYLDLLVDGARARLETRRQERPQGLLEDSLEQAPAPRPFAEALAGEGTSVIAEHKRRSPSAGAIREGADLAEIVRAYDAGGAAALSILTEEEHFGGSLEDLRAARTVSNLPLLRKDFVVDGYQLLEARAAGSDAVLLIAAAVEPEQLAELHARARELDLDVVVEVHDAEDLARALELDADVIGINNRDLRDFEVRLETTFELLPEIPAGKTVISESGIATRSQIEELERVGVDAVLIGEALMRAPDPCEALADLVRDEADEREEFKPS